MHKILALIGFFTIFRATTHGSLASGHSFRSKGNNFRSYLCKVCPPCSRPPSRPSLSPSSPASWAPSSPAWRVSSWSWSPPAWACRCGWPRQSSGAGTCPPCRRGASWAAPAAASRSGRSSALRTRGSEHSNIIVILHILQNCTVWDFKPYNPYYEIVHKYKRHYYAQYGYPIMAWIITGAT